MVMTKNQACNILGCSGDASTEEIRANYKRLALKWHPDKHSNSAEATVKFQQISEAYKRLTSADDDDNITISMGDMFDLFAHIFFTRRYYSANVDPVFFYDDRAYDFDDTYDDVSTDDYFFTGSTDDSFEQQEDYSEYAERDNKSFGFNGKGRNKYGNFRQTAPETQKKKNTPTYNAVSEAEAMRNAQELIKEEEQKKKQAEKKREKKKRNRAKRREKARKPTVITVVGSEEESRDEAKPRAPQQNEEDSSDESIHEESTWDTSSAFFSNAARRAPRTVNGATSSGKTTTVNAPTTGKCNSTRKERHGTVEVAEELPAILVKSRELAAEGNNLANDRKYHEAIEYFTRAINLHDEDFRFFGNRSYCYDRLGQYDRALEDAEAAISIAPVWSKGYFRKGRALAGLHQFPAAELAYNQVLKLDKDCYDAKLELVNVRVQQLVDMGFPTDQCETAVRLYGTVQASLDALLTGKVKCQDDCNTYTSDEETVHGTSSQAEETSSSRNSDECYFWRNKGCVYGDRCRFSHIPHHKGADLNKMNQNYGRAKPVKKSR